MSLPQADPTKRSWPAKVGSRIISFLHRHISTFHHPVCAGAFSLSVCAAISAWFGGGDMTLIDPVLGAAFIFAALGWVYAPGLSLTSKFIWVILSAGVFTAEWYGLFRHFHGTPISPPVISIDCGPTNLPNKSPPNGLNYIDFVFSLGDGGPIGVGVVPPNINTTWPKKLIATMPLHCLLSTRHDSDLYRVTFNLHVKYNQVRKNANGTIENGMLVGERNWPVVVARMAKDAAFDFYAFTTGEYMVYVDLPEHGVYVDGNDDKTRVVKFLPINWGALSFAPANVIVPTKK